nr:uncharacterized protein LOC105346232 [Crassostrea gigas]
MALPLLPSEHIRPAFEQLVFQVSDRPVLLDLLSYVEDTWINSTIWPIPSWPVYNKAIRTNNDCEGWHTRMNVDRAQGRVNVNFYLLLGLLRKEADLLPLHQRKSAVKIHAKISEAGKQYEEKELSTEALLKRLGRVYSPQ